LNATATFDEQAVLAGQENFAFVKEEQSKKPTIRLSPGLKRAIAIYADQHGVAETAAHFSQQINQPISVNSVRQLYSRHSRQLFEQANESTDCAEEVN